MCISKRFQSTGATGGHGMQEVDVLKRRMIEEKLESEGSESKILCGNGCEFTLLGQQIPLREQIILGDFIQANNLCPFCGTVNGRIDFEFCAKNQDKLLPVSFEMNDKVYDTMYKPRGYKFLPPEMIEDAESE